MVHLYWQIGRDIRERQQQQGWGAHVIDRLARDLRATFPDMKGFSPRNLKYMRALAEAWPDSEFVQQPAAQLPWFHLCTLLDKVKNTPLREWYAAQALRQPGEVRCGDASPCVPALPVRQASAQAPGRTS
jgi:hypothetical protein